MKFLNDIVVIGNGEFGASGGGQTHSFFADSIIYKTDGLKGDAGASTKSVFHITDGADQSLFEVRQNGDTVIAGILTVNGTGSSTFAGDVSIGGNLTVAGDSTATADLSGTDLTLSGNLVVQGSTYLGDNAAVDVTVIKGKTTVFSKTTKALGSNTVNAFEVLDSASTPLFEVRENGDTVIGGVLTVNGSGSSSFAGDVTIGGNLTVAGDSTATADLSGTDLTLSGNLIVQGNTTLGNDASVDTTDVYGVTTIHGKTTKAGGSGTTNVFAVVDSVGTALFEVKETGDTVIGGVLTVNGSGTSSMSSNLTLTGNLTVQGNTLLGDGVEDVLTVNATVTLPTTTTIGAIAYATLLDGVNKRHTQNTDTGTSSTTFQIGTGGPKIKNSGGEIQLRNAGDTGYADLRINNLYVEGTTTAINSNEVNIGDSVILLNSDITTNAQNSDGGIAIKRLKSDNTTRGDAELVFNNSNGRWEATQGSVETPQTFEVAVKKVFSIGDGAATSFVLTHNMNTRDIAVNIREVASPYAMVYTDVEFTSVNTITVKFAVAPTTNQFSVVLVG